MSTLRATNIKHELSATNQIVLGSDGSIGGTLGDTLAAKAALSNSIVQIVTASTNTPVTNSTSTNADTGLTATITPTSASNKVLVLVAQNGLFKSAGSIYSQMTLTLLRGATSLTNNNGIGYTGSSSDLSVGGVSMLYLDSPSTTSATTYKTVFNNAANAASVTANFSNAVSTIILLEIAA